MTDGHVGLTASVVMPVLRREAAALGFSQIGVAAIDLGDAEPGLLAWLAQGWHGEMDYMARHGLKRARPAELVPGTLSIITARMDYLPREAEGGLPPATGPGAVDADSARGDEAPPPTPAGWQAVEWQRLADPQRASVSVYARGRDYHKTLRQRLQTLAERLLTRWGPFGHRVFTDSAPVLEVELARRSGLGWRGKHTLALHRDAGSMFFLGEVFTTLPLPPTEPVESHCGSCEACLAACPTGAIVAPGRLDARRCISYLTIEHAGPIPLEWRTAMGNRIYGCDDCQLVCPWNKFARRSPLPDFDPRPDVADATLLALWAWREADFLRHTEGSAIRRIGIVRWRRNLAVALGNLLRSSSVDAGVAAEARRALAAARDEDDPLVREHIDWALAAA